MVGENPAYRVGLGGRHDKLEGIQAWPRMVLVELFTKGGYPFRIKHKKESRSHERLLRAGLRSEEAVASIFNFSAFFQGFCYLKATPIIERLL